MIDDEQEGFLSERRCVDQIFTLRQTGEKACKKILEIYTSFMDLKMVYGWVIREALWQMLNMYYVDCKLMNKTKSM